MDNRPLILLAGFVIQPAASAFEETPGFLSISQTQPATVEVRSTNGQLYNEVKSGSQIGFKADGACEIEPNGNKHYVETLTFTATLWPNVDGSADLQSLDHFPNNLPPMQVDVPSGIYPDGVDYPAAWRERAITACNTNLNHQIDVKGLSKNQALAKAWELKNVPLDNITGALRCGPAKIPGGFIDPGKVHEDTVASTMTVRCLKYSLDQVQATPNEPDPPGATDNVTNKVGVTQAVVTMVPDQYQGVCPAQLNASLTITTNGPVRVRYQLESDKGQRSSPRYINVDQTNTAFVNVRIPVGKAATGGSSPGNYGVTTAGGSGGSPSGSMTSTAAPSNVYQGFYRIHTLAPNEVSSAPSSFKVTCQPAQNQQLAIPSNSQPAAPLPAVQKMRTSPPVQQSSTQRTPPPGTPPPPAKKTPSKTSGSK